MEEVAVPGFELHRVHRSSTAARKDFGGVAIYVRSDIAKGIEVLRAESEVAGCEMLWMRLHLCMGGSILLGACYLAPEMSRVYVGGGSTMQAREAAADAAFGRLQQSVTELGLPDEEVLVIGDLNARVGSSDRANGVNDVTDGQQCEAVFDALGLDPAALRAATTGLPQRLSEDSEVNVFGRHLGAMCRSQGLVIPMVARRGTCRAA